MSGIKPALVITTSLLGLVLIWILLAPKTKQIDNPDKQAVNPQMVEQSENVLLTRIESLESELSSEQSIRQQIEFRLSRLEQQLLNSPAISHESAVIDTDTKPVKSPPPRIKPPTLQDKLLASSIPLDTIQRIQQKVGENRLARLQLRNQAIREEWIDSPEYIEKEQQLPRPTEGLKEQFGDEIYDQYLYASGRPNRVIVREVFSGSTAENADIQPGDIILSYASELIYSMNELQQATTEGIAGEPVLIEILRNDLPFSTSVARGPLGISMTVTRKKPE